MTDKEKNKGLFKTSMLASDNIVDMIYDEDGNHVRLKFSQDISSNKTMWNKISRIFEILKEK